MSTAVLERNDPEQLAVVGLSDRVVDKPPEPPELNLVPEHPSVIEAAGLLSVGAVLTRPEVLEVLTLRQREFAESHPMRALFEDEPDLSPAELTELLAANDPKVIDYEAEIVPKIHELTGRNNDLFNREFTRHLRNNYGEYDYMELRVSGGEYGRSYGAAWEDELVKIDPKLAQKVRIVNKDFVLSEDTRDKPELYSRRVGTQNVRAQNINGKPVAVIHYGAPFVAAIDKKVGQQKHSIGQPLPDHVNTRIQDGREIHNRSSRPDTSYDEVMVALLTDLLDRYGEVRIAAQDDLFYDNDRRKFGWLDTIARQIKRTGEGKIIIERSGSDQSRELIPRVDQVDQAA